ncbi:MAG TPA: hypothetical protein VM165_03620 [Planctomycetaceae bacterium]|nr:hypothetical protein [Planctomycetaceae bacterium]
MTPTAQHPFAFWTIFRGIHRWFLAAGCPPTLSDERRWVRGLRTSVLMGTLGFVSSWMTILWHPIEEIVFPRLGFGPWGLLSFSPGPVFGAIVLLPLSRWLGRGWFNSLWAVPVSTVAYYLAAKHPAWAGWIGGCGVGVWMIDLRRPQTYWLVPLTTLAGGLPYEVMNLLPGGDTNWTPPGFDWLNDLLSGSVLYTPFQTCVAIALGTRIWWPPANSAHDSPRPAANTAETSTAKPGSSTEDAVSPGLNSP